MYFGPLQHRPRRRSSQESGYMLIIVIFLLTAMVIGALAMTASMKEQIKRDREVEMIHRGVQYTRAIKRYYKKFGRYPATIEALENTNNIRFLRKQYKDPLSKDGKWVLLRYGQVQFGSQAGIPGLTSSGNGLPNVPGVNSLFGGNSGGGSGQSSFGQSSFGNSSFGNSSFGNSSFGNSSFGQNSSGQNTTAQPQGSTTGSTGTTGTNGAAVTGTGGTTNTTGDNSNSGDASDSSKSGSNGNNLGQSATGLIGTGAIGGGAIIGVASASKEESLRVVADKNHYNDWRFVYDPTFDRGALITGPYDPKKALGQYAGGMQGTHPIGVPAGQAGNGSSFGNSFGNNGSSFGSNGSSFGNGFGNSGFGNSGQQPQQPQPPAPQQQQ